MRVSTFGCMNGCRWNTQERVTDQVSSLEVHRMLREATQNTHPRGLLFVACLKNNFETRREEFHEFRNHKAYITDGGEALWSKAFERSRYIASTCLPLATESRTSWYT